MIVCDFCSKPADRHDEVIFVAAPSGLAHICEQCAELAVAVVAQRKVELGG